MTQKRLLVERGGPFTKRARGIRAMLRATEELLELAEKNLEGATANAAADPELAASIERARGEVVRALLANAKTIARIAERLEE